MSLLEEISNTAKISFLTAINLRSCTKDLCVVPLKVTAK